VSAPYFRVLPAPHSGPGNYLVGHATPGVPGCFTVDATCMTAGSAHACAVALNDQRGQQAAAELHPLTEDTRA
jgi:hypothetical protein